MTGVRRLQGGETALLRELRLAALREAPDAFARTLVDALTQPETYWTDMERSVTDPARHVMFVAEDGPRPVGLVFGIRKSRTDADLGGMWVDPRARGRGVGRALGQAVVDWARSEQFSRVLLWVTDGNLPAQTLYERLGFVATGRRDTLPSNPALATMEIRLHLGNGSLAP